MQNREPDGLTAPQDEQSIGASPERVGGLPSVGVSPRTARRVTTASPDADSGRPSATSRPRSLILARVFATTSTALS